MNTKEWISLAKVVVDIETRLREVTRVSVESAVRHYSNETVDRCVDCGFFLVPLTVWKQIDETLRPDAFAGTGSPKDGICVHCAGKRRAQNKRVGRVGGPLDNEALQRLRAAVNFQEKGM